MNEKNAALLALGAIGALTAASQLSKRRKAGSQALTIEQILAMAEKAKKAAPEPQAKPTRTARPLRSTVADELIPVGQPEPGWKPKPWISLDPIEGYEGSGPVLLIRLKSALTWRDATGTGMVAPGYPDVKTRKRDSAYELVRPVNQRGGRPARAKYTKQSPSKISLYPDRRRVGDAKRVMSALTTVLNEAPAHAAQVEALQAIGLLLLWRKNPLDEAQKLEEAVAGYIRQSDKVPSFIHDAVTEAEENRIVIERTYQQAPDHVSGDQLGGVRPDPLLEKTIGAALRRDLTSKWKDLAKDDYSSNDRPPVLRPTYVDHSSGQTVDFISNGAYALRQDAADWLTRHTPIGNKRRRRKGRPWMNDRERPDLNMVLDSPNARTLELRLVGRGTMTNQGNVSVFEAGNGTQYILSSNKLATVLAKALHDGGRVSILSSGRELDPVFVELADGVLEGVIMPIRNP